MPRRTIFRRIYQKSKKRSFLFFAAKLACLGLALLVFASFLLFIFFAKDLPRPEKFSEKQFVQSTKIYDRTGEILLYEIYGEEKRTIVPLSDMPQHLKEAVIASEDANFYKHFGVDPAGVLRSILINLRIKSPVYGGSTIPQQLIRSTFFSLEKTAERKIREIVLALELDRRYSKDQILEWYLNQVPFGQNSYGVEAASRTYFKKSVSQISLEEAAVLTALIQGPSRLSPYGENKETLLRKKDAVLDRMAGEGFVSQQEAEEAKAREITFNETPIEIKAPYFTLWVKQKLEEKYGEEFLRRNGLKVYTSLDWELQKAAEETAEQGLKWLKNYKAYNLGLTSIDPASGEILTMVVGSGDYYADPLPEGCTSGVDCLFDPKFNVVTGSKNNPGRQPGSAFKPFVYATAFKNGYTSTTTVVDEQTNFGIWGDKEYVPQNYDGKFRGEMTLREALAQSINVASVKVLLDYAGLEESVATAESLGITTLAPPFGPAIVLGGWEVKLIEMTSAYGVFANSGVRLPPVAILKIENDQGNIIEENYKTPRRVVSEKVSTMINDVLSDNVARTPMFGSRSYLYFDSYQVAAKTGTTQDYRDTWAIGYTPSIVTGVWVGNNNNVPMSKTPAVVSAGYIFHSFMEKALPKLEQKGFNSP